MENETTSGDRGGRTAHSSADSEAATAILETGMWRTREGPAHILELF